MYNRLFFCFIVVMVFFSFSALHAQDGVEINSKIPVHIQETMIQNAESLNPISLKWKSERSTELPYETFFLKIQCPYDWGFLEPKKHLFIWQNPKGYYLCLSKGALPYSSNGDMPFAYQVKEKGIELGKTSSEEAFDGEKFYVGSSSKKTEWQDPLLSIYSLAQMKKGKMKNYGALLQEYTIKIGYKFPRLGKELGEPMQSYILFLADKGEVLKSYSQTLDGDAAFVIELKANYLLDGPKADSLFTFWLLPKHNYALKQCEVKSLDGQLVHRFVNDDFFQVPGKTVYLPRKTVTTSYAYLTRPSKISSSPICTEITNLEEVSTKEIDDDQFNLLLKYTESGTKIGDRSLEDSKFGVQYTIPANPADLDRAIDAAAEGKEFVPTPLPPIGGAVRFALIFLGIVLLAFGFYWKFSLHKK
jgi:hypothetical protein